MAEVTEMTNVSTAIPNGIAGEPPKRGRGRPRKEIKAETKPEHEEDDEPAPEFSGNEDFWLMLQNFSDDEWNHLSAYVYRLAPKIDRKSNGRKANIQTYTSRFTLDDLMKDHGSGAYQVILNHQDPATGKYSRLAVEKAQILNVKYPPVVPDGDWVEDKDNEMWKWGANAVPSNINGGSYPPGFNISEMMDKADQRALKMVEIMTPKPTDTSGQNELLIKLIDVAMAKNNAPAPPPPDTTAMDRMFKMQDDMLKDMRDELRALRQTQAAPAKSIIEQFVELRPQIKELVDAFATKAGKTDIWAELAKEGIGQIPDLISLGRDFIRKSPEPQQNGHQRGIAAAPAATAAVSEPPAVKPAAEMTEADKQAQIDHLWKKWARRLLDISTKLIEDFTIQDQGYSFRDWYVEMYGKLNWAELRRDLANVDEQGVPHPELVTNMYHAHDQLRAALSPPEKLTAFLVETFTNFGEEEDFTVEDPEGGVESTEVIPAGKKGEAKTQ